MKKIITVLCIVSLFAIGMHISSEVRRNDIKEASDEYEVQKNVYVPVEDSDIHVDTSQMFSESYEEHVISGEEEASDEYAVRKSAYLPIELSEWEIKRM